MTSQPDCRCTRHGGRRAESRALGGSATMAWKPNYELVMPVKQTQPMLDYPPDMVAPVATLHRLALVSCERLMLLLNNTEMLRHRRVKTMEEVISYLEGIHDEVGVNGDRGDFYRRKLAEQLYLTFGIQGVDHTNILGVVDGAMRLERDCRYVLTGSVRMREVAAPIPADPTLLDILGRIAGMH